MLDTEALVVYTHAMTKKKATNRRSQTPKPVRSRSIETMEFQLQHRGSRIPSATQYKRAPKHRGKGWEE